MNTTKQIQTTGFSEIDKLTTGLPGGDFILIAARPGMGKTSIALDIAQHLANNSEKNTVYFSMELTTQQLNRWLQLKDGLLPECKSRLIFCDHSPITTKKIREICEQTENLGAIIIDYVQLIDSDESERMSQISPQLKTIAESFDIPVICLSQIHRCCEYHTDKRPTLSNAKKSKGFTYLSEYADQILFLYRDQYYDPDSLYGNTAECIISKNRHGDVGTVELLWDKERVSFCTLK